MSAPARKLPLLLMTLMPCLSSGVSVACPPVIELVTDGETFEFSRATGEPGEERPDEDWSIWLEALEVLRHGSREAKRALFDDVVHGDTPLYGIDLPPADDEALTRRAIEELTAIVAAERDDWLVDRIAAALAEEETDGASGLVEMLARHPLPSVRARAVEFVFTTEDEELLPTLEAMWAVERAPIVRARLLDALSAMDSEVHLDACPELLDHADYDLASAAIRCTGWQLESDAARPLLERASRGEAGLRVEALEQLEMLGLSGEDPAADLVTAAEDLWREGVEEAVEPALLRVLETLRSPLALEIATDLARGAGPLVEQALGMIGRASDPGLLPLLEAHARQGSLETRVAAVSALRWFETPTPLMDRILEDALEPSQPQPVRLAALEAMIGAATQAGRLGFLSWLETLALADPDDLIRSQAQAAAAVLERANSEEEFEIIHAGYAFQRLEPFEPVASGGMESLRCYRVPGEEPTPDRAARILALGSFDALDRYDDRYTTWRMLELADGTPCWLPQSRLRRVTAGEAAQDEPMLSQRELDLALEEVDSPAFARLGAAGIVEAFDRGTSLAGVRLLFDDPDEKVLEVLRAVDEEGDTPLGAEIRALLARLGTAPEAGPGDTPPHHLK